MRKEEFPLVDKLREEAYQQGRMDAIAEAESKVKEYASVWIGCNDSMSKQEIADKALKAAKKTMIRILENMKEQKKEIQRDKNDK